MRSVDTNIVVRYLVRDDEHQTRAADLVMDGECYVSATVLLETVWLLASRFQIDRDSIGRALIEMMQLPMVVTEHDASMNWAVTRFMEGADFADMIHLLGARTTTGFVTFDRKLARQAGPDSPVPIETID